MSDDTRAASNLHEAVLSSLRQLERRIERIEGYLQLEPLSDRIAPAPTAATQVGTLSGERPAETREAELEMRIGEFWLARVGIVALLTGLSFLIAYPFATLPAIVPSLLGFALVGGLLALSHHWRNDYQQVAQTLFIGGLVLFFIAALRLHFFSDTPALASKTPGLIPVVAVLGLQFYLAIRRRSEFLAVVATILGFAAGMISDTSHFCLALAVATSGMTVYLLKRFNWQILVNIAVVFAYSTHLLWLLNNPLLGHPIGAVAEHHNNLIYLFLYAAIFAAANLFHFSEPSTQAARMLRTILNGSGLFVLGNLAALSHFDHRLAAVNLAIAVFFLSAAVVYWVYRHSKYSTSIYACFGYLALSVAIISQFGSPDEYVWLSWQSVLVVSTAIWFRSRIVVVANIFIYLGILLAYLLAAPAAGLVNLNYAFVALLSARILNWQKQRLELKTELMRNTYLASAFVIIPYGLAHALPKAFVSLSWLGAAVFYFLLSLILKSDKYRWMAILTIFLTAIHAVVVDLAGLEPVYRIISFLALGMVLIIVSLLYARRRQQLRSTEQS